MLTWVHVYVQSLPIHIGLKGCLNRTSLALLTDNPALSPTLISPHDKP